MIPYKTDCYYYTEVHDMGACISQCKRYRQLGKCPCDNCTDYISNKVVHLVIQDYVRNKQPKTGHWINHREHCEILGVKPSGLGAYVWCSNCDCGIDVKEFHRNHYNYCPNCGADMRINED